MLKLKFRWPNIKHPFDRSDLFIAAGLTSIGIGLWWIYPPASLIVIGVIIFWMGLGAPMFRSKK